MTTELPAGAPARPVLAASGLEKRFPIRSGILRRVKGHVRAVDGVSLHVAERETLGLVGESGSGKSTVARLVLRLLDPDAGTIEFRGTDLASLGSGTLRHRRRDLQMVFQDPYSSLDPRTTVAEIVGEPLRVHERLSSAQRQVRVADALEQVGLDSDILERYPHEFSGGQRQRIAIARTLVIHPALVVCDEPVSSLDVSNQAQVINLLADLQERLGLAYLFISHDLAVVSHLSHRIAVLYLGRVVETGPTAEVVARPAHPYTEALLAAVPSARPERRRSAGARRRPPAVLLAGDPPDPTAPPSGCRFHPRCPYVMDVCRSVDPVDLHTERGTTVACHLHTDGPQLAGATVRDLPVPARDASRLAPADPRRTDSESSDP